MPRMKAPPVRSTISDWQRKYPLPKLYVDVELNSYANRCEIEERAQSLIAAVDQSCKWANVDADELCEAINATAPEEEWKVAPLSTVQELLAAYRAAAEGLEYYKQAAAKLCEKSLELGVQEDLHDALVELSDGLDSLHGEHGPHRATEFADRLPN